MGGWRQELSAQARLATPVIVTNLAMMGMGAVDMAMVGHLSTDAFAAVSLGHAWLWCFIAFGIGVLLALDPLVSQARGAGDEVAVARSLQRGVLLALALSLPLVGGLALVRPVFELLRQPAAIIPEASAYVHVSALGVAPLLVFVALRQTLQALGRVRPVLVVALAANLVNAALDALLIYGAWGFPRLGVVGCAAATVACDLFMALGLMWIARAELLPRLRPLQRQALRLRPLLRVLALGAPVGLQLLLEAGAFNAITFLMGGFGTAEMAGHRTALTLASISFMVPLGLSTAAAVRVGHAIGARDAEGTRRAARVALLAAALVMGGFALLFLAAPRLLAGLFTGEGAVLAVAVALLPMAAAFQLFDGLQVVAAGVLRGSGDTRWPMVLNLLAYWVLGLPLGTWWAYGGGGGPLALWWGRGGSLAFVALTLMARVRRRLARLVDRIEVDEEPLPLPVGPAGSRPEV